MKTKTNGGFDMKKEKKTINVDFLAERMDGLQETLAAEQEKAEKKGKWSKAAFLQWVLTETKSIFSDCNKIIDSYAETWSVKK